MDTHFSNFSNNFFYVLKSGHNGGDEMISIQKKLMAFYLIIRYYGRCAVIGSFRLEYLRMASELFKI